MSLLIKALDKAQEQAQLAKAKQAQNSNNPLEQSQVDLQQASTGVKRKPAAIKTTNIADLALELSPKVLSVETLNTQTAATQELNPQANLMPEPVIANKPVSAPVNAISSRANAQSAANVFTAKRIEANNPNTMIALIAGAGLLALLAMGAYFYQYIDNTPDVAIVKRLPPAVNTQAIALVETAENIVSSDTMPVEATPARPREPLKTPDAKTAPKLESTFETAEPLQMADRQLRPAKKLPSTALSNGETVVNENAAVENMEEMDEALQETKLVKNSNEQKASQRKRNAIINMDTQSIASQSASINVTKSQSQNSINPILMGAFEAYNAGKDAQALKLYKQVLQRDVRNVDALLGLGAIAQRQGRLADANGWYAKVLEVEPKNSIAMTSILDSQPQNDVASTESRIKNMLAKQPNDANLHASLGNFYAEANQWPAAQQAYFDAYRLNASADNALNLAVSLDQMGKPKLALPYYQQALALAQSGNSNIDKATLEARIAAIN